MRIAFMAMSGMGAAEAHHIAPAFDQPAFACRREAIASLPSLALLTLAGMTPDEHEVAYLEFDDIGALDRLPRDFDLVALSSYTAQIHTAYQVAGRYTSLGIPTVIGGPHVSCLPEEAAAYCDAVVVGEGESAWPQVVEDAQRGRLQPRYGSLAATFDLRQAPMPAYHLLDGARYNRITVETSRGCPNHCEFCASSILISGKYKQKPAERVLAEIDRIGSLWSRPFIEFADDNTFVSRDYWMDLLPELKKRRFRWFAEADIRLGRDDELLRLMREAGCVEILIGLESPEQAHLDGVELRGNWKREQDLAPAEAVRNIQDHGIMVNGCFVVGLDSQGPDVFDAIYDFVDGTDLFDVQVTFLTPFPGTPLYGRLKDEGRLVEERAWSKCTLYDCNFIPRRMSVEEVTQGYSRLVARLYDDTFTQRRRHRIRQRLRSRATRSIGM